MANPKQFKLIDETLTSATASSVGAPASNEVKFQQRFLNFRIDGITDSTVDFEISLDKGSTWQTCGTFTADTTNAVLHGSPGVQYRFNVTTYGGAGDSIAVLLLN